MKLKLILLSLSNIIVLTFFSSTMMVAQTFEPGKAGLSPSPVLKHSDVAIWFDMPDDHLKYPDVDVIVQDLDIVDEIDLPEWQEQISRWHEQGKRVFAELRPATPLGKTFERLMDDPGMREAGCVDFNGNPISPGWQEGRTYKGYPVQFFCSNNPRYRSFLRYLIYLYHEAGVDGLFVDDAGGNPASVASGGCLCQHCLKRFQIFLQKKYTPDEWDALKLGDLNKFDYKQIVLSHASNLTSFRVAQKEHKIPLLHEFADFQRESDAELFKSLHAEMDKLCGRHVPMAWDNFNFSPARTAYYPTLDVFAPEINFGSFAINNSDNRELPYTIVMLNRISDGMGKWYSPIPAPPTWKANETDNLTGLLRLWIAVTYANGGLPRYPRKGWAGIQDGVVDWYYPAKENFKPLYDFVRANRYLFDGYENIGQVGVVFSEQPAAVIGGGAALPLKHITESLVSLNIPYGIVVAGEKVIPQRLNADVLKRYELVLVPESARLDAPQQLLVENWKNEGKAFIVSGHDDLETLLKEHISSLVALENQCDVRLFPRGVPEKKDAPVVCHMVNWNYDPETNTTVPQKDVKVKLSTTLVGDAKVTKVIYHTIGEPELSLDFVIQDNAIHVTVPEVSLWGVIELKL